MKNRSKLAIAALVVVIMMSFAVPASAAPLNAPQAVPADCFTFDHHQYSRFMAYFSGARSFYSSWNEQVILYVYVAECGKYLYGVFDSNTGGLITHYFPKEKSRGTGAGLAYILDKLKWFGAISIELPKINFGSLMLPLPIPCYVLAGGAGCGGSQS